MSLNELMELAEHEAKQTGGAEAAGRGCLMDANGKVCSEGWIRTHRGGRFFPLFPELGAVDLGDIAVALANLCRFTGHTKAFYSVAQHSLLCSILCPVEMQFAALMHDAAEAYLGDVARPMKPRTWINHPTRGPILFKDAERAVADAICQAVGLPGGILEDDRIKATDDLALAMEARDLMGVDPTEWGLPGLDRLPPARIVPWPPALAAERFIERFAEATCLDVLTAKLNAGQPTATDGLTTHDQPRVAPAGNNANERGKARTAEQSAFGAILSAGTPGATDCKSSAETSGRGAS